ncbi:MAG: hypothetical protein GOP50_09995 [Candidatus Heimdallarchaeota archaeon]|nr:hypothetical protein [Candidatus Heimdallarchaeota archaeon]
MKTKPVVVFSILSIGIIVTLAVTIPMMTQEESRVQFIHITSDEEFVNYNLPGSGSIEDPYIIESFNLGFEEKNIKDYSPLLYLTNITKHVIIRNNLFNGSHIAILIDEVQSSSVLIEDNYFISQDQCVNGICFNSFYGIKIVDSNTIVIRDNEFQESNYEGYIYGIFFERCENLEIIGNKISSFYAIYALESFYFTIENNYYYESVDIYFEQCSYFDIKNNIHDYIHRFKVRYSSFMNFENNIVLGYNDSFGVILEQSIAMDIINNTFFQNVVGVSLINTHEIRILNNFFETCTGYAIELLDGSSSNIIQLNGFVNNNLNSATEVQALDNGFFNSWSNELTEKGNYWSNIGTRLVYDIDGEAKARDYYPLTEF